MCLTAPVQVLSVDGLNAVVEAGGVRRSASAIAVPDVRPGQWAILAAGALVRILEPEVAEEMIAALRLATTDEPVHHGGKT
jgi:hydrogenase expression/formation protein HypC